MQVLGVWGQHLLWLQQQEWVLSEVEAEGGAPGQLSLQGLVERPHLRVEGGAACREEGIDMYKGVRVKNQYLDFQIEK